MAGARVLPWSCELPDTYPALSDSWQFPAVGKLRRTRTSALLENVSCAPGLQVAGSLLLLRITLDMLHAKHSAAQRTRQETEAGVSKDDMAITPLGVRMLAGPGAISTSLIGEPGSNLGAKGRPIGF